MEGIQLGAGSKSHSTWNKNFISAEEVSHVNNVRLGEKLWDWLCDAVCGTHRAEAKEYIRQLDALENKPPSETSSEKRALFFKLSNLTSNDYINIDRSNGELKYQIGYFKGNVEDHQLLKTWTRPELNSNELSAQESKAKGLKDRLVKAFDVQIQSQGKPTLRLVPVYMAHRYASSELSPPLHAYIMAGEPGSKNALLFGEKNDMTRSKVELNDAFLAELSKAKYVTRNDKNEKVKLSFEPELIQAVERLKNQGRNFAFLDGFVDAIKRELNKFDAEMKLTESHRIGLGYLAAKCNGQQGFYNMDPRKGFTHNEDMRYFEQQKGPVKQQPVKLTTLQEVTREQRVYQDYLNEKLGLNGVEQTKASIRVEDGTEVLPESEKKKLKDRTMVAYTALPTNSPFESNCNRTAATYFQAAINRDKGLPIDVYQEVKSGTRWALGGNTRRHIHNPLQSQRVTKDSIGEQEFFEIQQRHPHATVLDEHSMDLGKKEAKDLKLQNSQDTGYSRLRAVVNSLSNFFTSQF
ncbi:hypothetical protein [uncultured Shewanella sp.]|uniref:hypothetical protein n=1 Tax=uncultured Shewanella sp. TaxID=173975 RepID=UPI00260EB0EB|nr:hypothetical protein [uncultured Shewanella sp.]